MEVRPSFHINWAFRILGWDFKGNKVRFDALKPIGIQLDHFRIEILPVFAHREASQIGLEQERGAVFALRVQILKDLVPWQEEGPSMQQPRPASGALSFFPLLFSAVPSSAFLFQVPRP